MAEARVSINLKEGIIELQGPLEFVQHYLDLYAPMIKGLPSQAATKTGAGEKTKTRPRHKSGSKRVTASAAIRKLEKEGFFNEPRSTGEIKQRLTDAGFTFSDSNVRSSLRRLTESKTLSATGKSSTLRYVRAGQS